MYIFVVVYVKDGIESVLSNLEKRNMKCIEGQPAIDSLPDTTMETKGNMHCCHWKCQIVIYIYIYIYILLCHTFILYS